MSVTIRLAKFGKKHAPSYRIVAATTRSKRRGSFLNTLGHFYPLEKTQKLVLDKKLLADWIAKGAIVTDAVKKLAEGKYEYIKYVPKKLKTSEEETSQGSTKEQAAPAAPEE